MRWAWPFEGRVGDHRDEGDNRSSPSDSRPDFLCVGAQKGGTTWLYQQLDSHPDFWMPPIMEVHYRQIEPFEVTDIDDVNRNLLRRGMLLRSYPSATVARWKRHVHPDLFRVYFFDDLQRNPTELRRSILHFLGADPDKKSDRLTADYNSWAGMEKLQLTDKVRSHLARFFKKELKACAAQLGGPAREWPARYGFSLLCFFAELVDNFDLFVWCGWVA